MLSVFLIHIGLPCSIYEEYWTTLDCCNRQILESYSFCKEIEAMHPIECCGEYTEYTVSTPDEVFLPTSKWNASVVAGTGYANSPRKIFANFNSLTFSSQQLFTAIGDILPWPTQVGLFINLPVLYDTVIWARSVIIKETQYFWQAYAGPDREWTPEDIVCLRIFPFSVTCHKNVGNSVVASLTPVDGFVFNDTNMNLGNTNPTSNIEMNFHQYEEPGGSHAFLLRCENSDLCTNIVRLKIGLVDLAVTHQGSQDNLYHYWWQNTWKIN